MNTSTYPPVWTPPPPDTRPNCYFVDVGLPGQPRHWIYLGAMSYNGSASGVKAGGLVSFGVRISPTAYSYTTQQTAALGSSMRTGIATILYRNSTLALLGLVDAGMSTGSGGSIGASFSGGGVAAIRIDKWTKQANTCIGVDFRVSQNNAAGVASKPVISIVLAKGF